MPKQQGDGAVLVIGLGRFGSAIASTLDDLGREVLALEKDPDLVQRWSHRFRIIEADATNADALEQVGAKDFTVAVVGVGTALESSVLVTANLVDIGMQQIWAKAISRSHGRILRRIGAHHVVYPEFDAGARVAHTSQSHVVIKAANTDLMVLTDQLSNQKQTRVTYLSRKERTVPAEWLNPMFLARNPSLE